MQTTGESAEELLADPDYCEGRPVPNALLAPVWDFYQRVAGGRDVQLGFGAVLERPISQREIRAAFDNLGFVDPNLRFEWTEVVLALDAIALRERHRRQKKASG